MNILLDTCAAVMMLFLGVVHWLLVDQPIDEDDAEGEFVHCPSGWGGGYVVKRVACCNQDCRQGRDCPRRAAVPAPAVAAAAAR